MKTKFVKKQEIIDSFELFSEDTEQTTLTFCVTTRILMSIKSYSDKVKFYRGICVDILDENTKELTIEEKDHFLNIHHELVSIFNAATQPLPVPDH